MNEELLKIAQVAGAPAQVLEELWFHVFCLKFAHLLLEMAEAECSDI